MNKWVMFKNYMHNELGISKDDIHQWINEAVKDIARHMVNQEFESFNIGAMVRSMVLTEPFFGGKTLKDEVQKMLAKELSNRISIAIDRRTTDFTQCDISRQVCALAPPGKYCIECKFYKDDQNV